MEVELAFDQKRLRQLCESEAKAKHELGESVAAKLKARLADLRAATSVMDLVAGCPHEHLHGEMAINLIDGFQMIFSSNHAQPPLTTLGLINWGEVSRIKILKIEKP